MKPGATASCLFVMEEVDIVVLHLGTNPTSAVTFPRNPLKGEECFFWKIRQLCEDNLCVCGVCVGGNQQLCWQQESKRLTVVNGKWMIHGAVGVNCPPPPEGCVYILKRCFVEFR